jgi:hypothetical protein
MPERGSPGSGMKAASVGFYALRRDVELIARD